jgi:hypothetical protein
MITDGFGDSLSTGKGISTSTEVASPHSSGSIGVARIYVKQAGWLRSKSKIIFVFMKKQDPQNNVPSKKN